MTVYYLNSVSGSDSNTGTSENAAFASLKAIEGLKLKAGDSVLLSANSVFEGQLTIKYSGSEGRPITFGSYGEGADPIITGGNVGIYGSKTHDIVIENIHITETSGNAIYAGSAKNWVIDNVTVTDTGSAAKAGSISLQSSQNMTITNSEIVGVHNDGIWMQNVKGATITNTTVTNSVGHNADAIQLNGTSNIVLRDNNLDMSGSTGSAKGVLVLVGAHNALVEGNTITGGGFGIAAYGEEIVIKGNEISNFGGYTWSYGIGLGQQTDAKNYTITDNYIHDGKYGVSISAAGVSTVVREGIDVFGNVFDDLTGAAIKVDRAASGNFHDNIIESGVNTSLISSIVVALNTFTVSGNETVESVQSYLDKLFGHAQDTTAGAETGGSVTPPHVEETQPTPVPVNTTTPAAEVVTPSPVPEVVTTNPSPVDDVGLIVLPRDTSLNAVNDVVRIDGSADTLVYTGNILDNDHSGNGQLYLRRFDDMNLKNKNDLTIEGKHGTIHIEADGDFTYTVHTDSLSDTGGTVYDRFQYKVSNVAEVDTGSFAVIIDSHSLLANYAADHLGM